MGKIEKDHDYQGNVGLIGSGAIGKTLFTIRLTQQVKAMNNKVQLPTYKLLDGTDGSILEFSDGKKFKYLPTVFDSQENYLTIDNTIYKIVVYDTAGQIEYHTIGLTSLSTFQKGKKIRNFLLFMFDITDAATFEYLDELIEDYKGIQKEKKADAIILANKMDLIGKKKPNSDAKYTREVSTNQIEELKKRHGIKYDFEISALAGNNVKAVLMTLVEILKTKKSSSCRSK